MKYKTVITFVGLAFVSSVIASEPVAILSLKAGEEKCQQDILIKPLQKMIVKKRLGDSDVKINKSIQGETTLTIKLFDRVQRTFIDDNGKTIEVWGPHGAVYDFILSVDYHPIVLPKIAYSKTLTVPSVTKYDDLGRAVVSPAIEQALDAYVEYDFGDSEVYAVNAATNQPAQMFRINLKKFAACLKGVIR